EKDERENRDADRNRDGLSIGLALPLFFRLPDFQTFPLDLLVVIGACRLSESVDRIVFIEPEGSGIGPDKASRKHLIGQLGEVPIFQRLHKISSNSRLGCDFVDGEPLGLSHLLEKFSDRFHGCLSTALAVSAVPSRLRHTRRPYRASSPWSAFLLSVVRTPACNTPAPVPIVTEPGGRWVDQPLKHP